MTTEHKRFPVAAAAIAGTLENFATFPFEYVKTQLQLQIRSSALYAGSSAYTGPLDVVQRTFRTAGLLGLYSGGASFVIFSPLRAVVRFTTFERLRITARSQQLRETPGGKRLSDLGCGVLAGAADGALCQTPSNAIAVKMVHDQSPRGPRQYRLGGGPSWHAKSGIRFVGYGEMAERLRSRPGRPEGPIAIWESLVAGGTAGGVSAVLSQPIDVVRANMMSLDARRYSSSLACARAILRSGGLPGLFLGVGPRICRVCVEESLKFTLFEAAERQLCALFPP
ncbi:mitochondrial citrate carrier [Emiliania huxleyi CCMP1516]|uniref:Uncharacterized protein n=2 Tax=Emiliania huxleyi TaxID=2903 RepID=A0A0D3IRW3_EMIH1|nr:mitochondrial citrate carrier [Emiliania huxleyi CCMP1516]XP_005792001.1 mitochondrial citrate carrier [Emiliania huxleyi CCMP1516]EOD13998.1 mitochondrial citrate carrier [Emiliania huxleyi CCMP1516]EOD39572.1 mitochondrial citrate carrier [Emiliania huxleyi CCMP1516]|eukprot:XP_005766427.1 mitochondrial citrate carrier [Emiliania huxleyi CCMP1516]